MLSLALALSARTALAQAPIVDIGTPGGDTVTINAINAGGQIAGWGRVTGNTQTHAALWTPDFTNGYTGTWTDLGALDDTYSLAWGLNDFGLVVGETNTKDANGNFAGTKAFVWTPAGPNATTGSMMSIGTLGGLNSNARAINNSGQIVGASLWTFDPAHESEFHAYLWTIDGGMIDLGTLGGSASFAMAVSADGKVAGTADTADGERHAFLWTPTTPNGTTGSMQDLGTLGGGTSDAYGMNAMGQVVGISDTGDGVPRAFLWTPDASDGVPGNPQMLDLGIPPNGASFSFGINDRGFVAGAMAGMDFFHSMVWAPYAANGTTGIMVDTLTLGGSFAVSFGINNALQVAGYSYLTGDVTYDDPNFGTQPIVHAFVSGAPGSGKFAQMIAFDALPTKNLGDPDFTVLASSSVGLPVSFDASGSCSVTGTTVHLVSVGNCTITASQSGSDNFDPASPVPQTLSVDGPPRTPQTISFAPIANKLVGDPDFQVAATASSGLPVTFSATYDCTLVGSDTVHMTGVGSCLVSASQAGDTTYAPAQRGRSFFISTTPVTSTLIDIGTLGGGQVNASKINAFGQVAGTGYIADDSYQHASLWTPSAPNATTGGWTDLGVLGAASGGVYSNANGLNDLGQVVGLTNMGMDNGNSVGDQAYLWTPNATNGTTGVMTPLGTLGGSSSEAMAINNAQQVVGWSFWTNDTGHQNEPHVFLWTPGTGMIDLGDFGGTEVSPVAISQGGKIVGRYFINNEYRAFLWTPSTPNGTTGSMIDIGTLGGTMAFPAGINSAGEVVGSSFLPGNLISHAFVWKAGTGMVDLGTLGGDHSEAAGINDGGTIVGRSQVGSVVRPFIWTPSTPNGTSGTMVDMLTLGGTYADGRAINNAGQITGSSSLDGDPFFKDFPWGPEPTMHAFITAPVSAPSGSQTITFGSLANKTYGDTDFGVSATASSGLTVSFGANGNCSIVGTTVHITGAGSCTITASQAGNSSYAAAVDVPRGFTIAKATAMLTLVNLTQAFTGTPRTVTVTTTPNGLSTVAVTYKGSPNAPTNAGSYAVVASLTNDNYQATNATGTLVITAGVRTLALNPTAVLGGTNVTGTVTLTAKAPAGGTSVALTSSNTSAATVPATVTVPANATSATFTVTTLGVGAPASTVITATWGVAKAESLTVNPAALANVTLNPATVSGGDSVAGTVTLTGIAPAGGAQVTLSSSLAAAGVPPTVLVAAGDTSAPFAVSTTAVAATIKPVISSTYLGVTKKANLTVNAPALTTVTVAPATVQGGTPSAGTVQLSGVAPTGGLVVTLSSSKANAASVPPSVTVPAGASSAPFTITTAAVKGTTSVTITAAVGPLRKTATVTVTK
jgi:probable HAF family extracellular repeat protein